MTEHDAIIVIRTVGERTFDLCHHLVRRQISEDRISVIRGEPYFSAIRKSYEIGIDSGARWMLVVDPDRFIHERAIEILIHDAEKWDDRLFQLRGLTLDKFFGGSKDGSIRIYRTAHLKDAIKLLPGLQAGIDRPDTYIIKEMAKRGRYERIMKDVILCMHDFEQSYKDIYRKTMLHSRKHRAYLPLLVPMWQRLSSVDFDYQVALWGAQKGLIQEVCDKINSNGISQGIEPQLAAAGYEEKTALDPVHWNIVDVGQFIETYQSPPEYEAIRQLMEARRNKTTRWHRIQSSYRRLGVRRFVPWILGKGMSALGHSLQSKAEQT